MHAGLRPRDVALSKALNTDKLSQLFVKANHRTLDAGLAAPHTHPDLPVEARTLVVLKRGTGAERNAGLLLVEKLDYLQLLAVEAVRDGAVAFWKGFVAALKDLSVIETGGSGDAAPGDASDACALQLSSNSAHMLTVALRSKRLLVSNLHMVKGAMGDGDASRLLRSSMPSGA